MKMLSGILRGNDNYLFKHRLGYDDIFLLQRKIMRIRKKCIYGKKNHLLVIGGNMACCHLYVFFSKWDRFDK